MLFARFWWPAQPFKEPTGVFAAQDGEHHFLLHSEMREQIAVEEGAALFEYLFEVGTGHQVATDPPAE